MQSIHNYDIYIFDCDGVILDSNRLKIDAMTQTLNSFYFKTSSVDKCIEYFTNNFGLSRFHHVKFFLENFLGVRHEEKQVIQSSILERFASHCDDLYLTASITSGFEDFISSIHGQKYIASGSEQVGLVRSLRKRGLDVYFSDIYGSPESKSNLVLKILKKENNSNAVMFGDAVSDLIAAKENGIDFIGYLKHSNVSSSLTELALNNGHSVINSWGDIK
ncbi:HAD family hydrolase [Candidatus Pantoea floridensis]|uniref:phosphoglycolate phosphatase n=1 Tax=Candidatus Pantoea floridensis TaxID=1938870 RepID=A0A286BVN4_9GAMM|nr:HAD hydrolase-like protein [Pantoea floridensis]PIF20671.1 phosphoglycolate phosphatase-like HAD superfamily hydrolase [Enterobacteriaceae bacterium JKS000233]SOD38188.1 Phosphoglycolate phosphatase, HAD superfamily [Pantoea floridensis]